VVSGWWEEREQKVGGHSRYDKVWVRGQAKEKAGRATRVGLRCGLSIHEGREQSRTGTRRQGRRKGYLKGTGPQNIRT
jgi:hypothetical protein